MLQLRYKIMGLIILTAIILLGSTFAYHYARTKEEHFFNYIYLENSKASIESILNIKKESFLKSTLNDAAWDELVSFIGNHKSKWADDNLATIYKTLDLSFIQVYDPRFKLLYSVIDSSQFSNPKLAIPVVKLKDAAHNHNSFHFFIFYDNRVMEIFGASIVPTIDILRQTKPQGFLITGRLWDHNYINNLQNAANSDLEIIPVEKLNDPKIINDPREKDFIVVHRFLHDESGKSIARLDFIPRTQLGLDRKLFFYFTIVPIFIALLVILFFFLSIRRWISLPLSRIAQSLNNEDPLPLKQIGERNKEFHAISERMEAFFEAKRNLENEIRERKLAEDKIDQYARELKESNVSKDKFFSILAHDLKSPFHSILGYSEILSHEYDTLNDTERRKFIDILRDSVKNVFDLLENLLQWSRMQSGRMEYHAEIFNLSGLIEEAADLLRGNALKKNIRFTYSSSPGLMVNADKNMIRSVLQNLISNALKFTSGNGEVSISSIETDNFIEVIVRDTGIGMSPDDLNKLFRIDVSFTRKGTSQEVGTGLGLILCKELLQKNRGNIWVESEKDKGTVFHFTLPKE
jgi:signal transduction histidine kinase